MHGNKIDYFSLFSGIGGFELGLQRAWRCLAKQEGWQATRGQWNNNIKCIDDRTDGLSCVGFCEIDKHATTIYQRHFPTHSRFGDVTRLDLEQLPNFDLLCGGFPCQAFSLAGKRGGFKDTRGTLFFEIARIAREKQPRILFLENVKGLLSHDQGQTFRTILSTLDELGYDLQWQVLNSKDFGVPQNRERVFIVGHLRGSPKPKVFPIKGSGGQPCKILGRLEAINGHDYLKRVYSASGASPTLPTGAGGNHEGKFLIDDVIRRLTPIECERLQGFPDNWTEGVADTHRYRCLGNAVTVNVIEAIGERLLNCLNAVSSGQFA